MGARANNMPAAYVDWEEVVVSSDKGRRAVHYYLKRSSGGGKDLVVVGKEKSVRHMTYHYMIQDSKLLLPILSGSSRLKLRSRREVIDWLNSILSASEWSSIDDYAKTDNYLGCRNIRSISKSWLRASESPFLGELPNNTSRQFGGGIERNLDDDIIENVLRYKSGQYGAESTWLGSSWTCRKRRLHYQSFCRNGAVISAQEFVYVLAEEGKRLVAYLDDMYEDTRGNKMVVVRWFHKIDEVGFVMPQNYNDREIFFSLCLQDLSIECIDGLATVLSPEHYETLTNEAKQMGLAPFVCGKLFDNDDVKPFDITQIKGYWKQEIFKSRSVELSGDDPKSKGSLGEAVGFRPNKRLRWSKECDLYLKSPKKEESEASVRVCNGTLLHHKAGMKTGSVKEGCSTKSLPGQDTAIPKSGQCLGIGTQVEVLSQDSGIRGCWFRALIIKMHKDKVKVQYKDVKDALDESKNLEEWVLASRLAASDAFGIRLSGRTMVRPNPSYQKGIVPGVVNIGCVVDAWWHDGWWEGIIVKKESEDRLYVYFPAEKQEKVFSAGELRHSKEWIDNGWQNIKQRPDLVSAFNGANKTPNINQDGLPFDEQGLATPINNSNTLPQLVIKIGASMLESDDKMSKKSRVVRDLSKDHLLARLRWKSSGKRRRSRSPIHKAQFGNNSSSVEAGYRTFQKFFVDSPMNFDTDNCKYASDPHFSASVPPLTNLVMSR